MTFLPSTLLCNNEVRDDKYRYFFRVYREINLKCKYRYFLNIRTVILVIPAIPEQAILIIPDGFGGIRRISSLSLILNPKQTQKASLGRINDYKIV